MAIDLRAAHAQHAVVLVGVQHVGPRAVGAEFERRQPQVVVAPRDHDGSGAVTEENRGRAVLVVGDPAERLCAADEDEAGAAGLDERRRVVECVEEPGARGVDVQRLRARAPSRAATSGASPGVMKSGVTVADDGLASTSPAARPASASASAQAATASVVTSSPSRSHLREADAGPPDDPLVARVEAGGEIVIGDDLAGQGRRRFPRPLYPPLAELCA